MPPYDRPTMPLPRHQKDPAKFTCTDTILPFSRYFVTDMTRHAVYQPCNRAANHVTRPSTMLSCRQFYWIMMLLSTMSSCHQPCQSITKHSTRRIDHRFNHST
ncbi:unnamed protein product [Laminaria digitata]